MVDLSWIEFFMANLGWIELNGGWFEANWFFLVDLAELSWIEIFVADLGSIEFIGAWFELFGSFTWLIWGEFNIVWVIWVEVNFMVVDLNWFELCGSLYMADLKLIKFYVN